MIFTILIIKSVLIFIHFNQFKKLILGKEEIRHTKCNNDIINDLLELSKTIEYKKKFDIISGKTLCVNDFYEGIYDNSKININFLVIFLI
jgi:hypothetical protein